MGIIELEILAFLEIIIIIFCVTLLRRHDMNKQNKYPDDWQLISADSSIVLKSRLKIFWEYVILGRKPFFTIEAWISPISRGENVIGDLRIYTNYSKSKETKFNHCVGEG